MTDADRTDSVVFNRRDFLKLVGLGAIGAAGCAPRPAERLIPYLVPPEDILPGVGYWYASTCRECPAGCGILVKAREGRAVKIEGNPAHPVNRGGVCARGHAALQALYDPDRVRGPLLKSGGAWKPVSWDEALKTASAKLAEARSGGKSIALVTDNVTGSLHRLADAWAAAAGGTHLVYEPFTHHALREANRRTFNVAAIPAYDFGRAGGVISFGADFLETWLNPVGFARDFAEMRARPESFFVTVEPRLSNTGANADEWIAVRPGGEMAVALGMALVILQENLGPGVAERAVLLDAVKDWTPDVVEQQTDVPATTLERVARRFANARPTLAVAGGVAAQSEMAVALIAAVNLLNYVAGNIGQTVRFDRTLDYDAVASLSELQRLAGQMADGSVGALVVYRANPMYATPAWARVASAIGKVPFRISLSPALDETTEACDLILPSTHALESLGDAETARGVYSIVQPAMAPLPMFDARPPGDTLLALAKGAGFGAFPASYAEYLKGEWKAQHAKFGNGQDFDAFWDRAVAAGGVWEDVTAASPAWVSTPAFAAPELRGAGNMALIVYPSPNLFDGRGANKSWLQEVPDPTTKAVWGSWAEIHPDTANQLGVHTGDPLEVETEAGKLVVPAFVWYGIRKDAVAIPLGQGHTAYGRYAKDRGVNALALLLPLQDQASGSVAYLGTRAKVARASGAKVELVRTQLHREQADREIAQVVPVAVLLGGAAAPGQGRVPGEPGAAGGGEARGERGAAAGAAASLMLDSSQSKPGANTEPHIQPPGTRPPAHSVSASEPEHVVRGPRRLPVDSGMYAHAKHRWALAIDINACTGCSACVAACYAENNIPIVGPEHIKRGREMAWIRIERFEEQVAPGRNDIRFVPMMCQHCSDAPCETVCPVYATYHNPEGLNVQVYNRCVGTRYCSNNCPYKVRAFNFFDYSAPEKPSFAFPEPLNWQLNPDVTVRSKGVMEKCTMCVQRILEGKGNAKDEGRDVRDGEIVTACAQSCPTQAIVFGDLLDPNSRVAKLSYGERRYWVLNELNTKPGVTYLKKFQREIETT